MAGHAEAQGLGRGDVAEDLFRQVPGKTVSMGVVENQSHRARLGPSAGWSDTLEVVAVLLFRPGRTNIYPAATSAAR